ncbi:MAG TPA: NAD(P)H-hydrate dehydratase [Terriglobales bacterium]|nr:NAD(P)H-hydrate dehydratase [Terriglobales bacterium]
MKILTAAEMRECDRLTSERHGVPSLTLMENAGTAVADFVLAHWPNAGRVAILCGKGNNGGDGFVAARKLHLVGKVVEIILLADPRELKGDALAMFRRLPIKPAVVTDNARLAREAKTSVAHADLILDAILGTGFRPPVSGLYAEAIAAINAAAAPVLAVDIPSGADADAMHPADVLRARADAVVTFTSPRPAHAFAQLTTGPTVVAPIGSPADAIQSSLNLELLEARTIAPLLADRRADANKGSYGHVLVIGGSLGKAGAAAMAGMGALRSGAGLATVATPRSVLPTVAGFAAELMTEALQETEAGTISLAATEYGRLDAVAKGKTVVALGPGISRHADTVEFIRAIVAKYPVPTVIDADGLNAFEGTAECLSGSARPLIITPHPGEMARLTGLSVKQIQADRISTARAFAAQHRCTVVLKGYRTIIAQPDGRAFINPTGNPGMATGGTGDILTGMIAGFVAQHPQDVTLAAAAAVYLHGLAGDVALEGFGEQCLLATDLLKFLPDAIRRTRAAAQSPAFTF